MRTESSQTLFLVRAYDHPMGNAEERKNMYRQVVKVSESFKTNLKEYILDANKDLYRFYQKRLKGGDN